jgi:hypothetical protein
MNTRNTSIALVLSAVLAIAVVPMALQQQAFAHAHISMDVPESAHLMGKQVSVVVGHTSEPTFGVEPGVADGKHNMEVLLSDSATKLPLTGAVLKADKYYFKNIESFNKASSVNDADEIVKNVTIGGVFGDAGHYVARQVQSNGIYGYHIYGTIDYFKVAQIPIDTTVFCTATDGDTSKFNSPGWGGAFGCTGDINKIAFPKDAISSKTNDNNGGTNANLTILAEGSDDQALSMYAKVRQDGKIVKSGFTPFTFEGKKGETYQIGVANFGDNQFSQWEDGSTNQRNRTVTLSDDDGEATFTAQYTLKATNTTSTTSAPLQSGNAPATSGISFLLQQLQEFLMGRA